MALRYVRITSGGVLLERHADEQTRIAVETCNFVDEAKTSAREPSVDWIACKGCRGLQIKYDGHEDRYLVLGKCERE